MKKLLGGVVVVLLTVTIATTQAPRLYTLPSLPSPEVLDRLSLTLAWHNRLLTDGPEDGLFSLQLLPAKGHYQIIVQSRKGTVFALDAETGDLLWQTQVGPPYWLAQPAAYNARALYVTRRDVLYSLDRATGKQLFEAVYARTNRRGPGVTLSAAPTAAGVADEFLLFMPFGPRVSAFELPPPEGTKRPGQPPYEDPLHPPPPMTEPALRWDSPTSGLRIEQPLLLGGQSLGAVSPGGTFFSLSALERTDPIAFKTDRPVAAAMGQFDHIAYLASEDGKLYALNIESTQPVWSFPAGAAIFRKPAVTTQDVYVSPERVGLFRVDRKSGVARWLNQDALQFLAVNKGFVYATDQVGRFLVLDYDRGTTLARYDLRDYPITFSNELTDRVYLASHSGLIVCLHHRDLAAPLLNKLVPPPAAKGKPKPKEQDKKPEADKDMEDKKADEPKDQDDKKPGPDKENGAAVGADRPACFARGNPSAPSHLPTPAPRAILTLASRGGHAPEKPSRRPPGADGPGSPRLRSGLARYRAADRPRTRVLA
jgi:outer membrane protein assembly factor BamB